MGINDCSNDKLVKDSIELINILDDKIIEVWQKLIVSEVTKGMSLIYDMLGILDNLLMNIDKINKCRCTNMDILYVSNVFLRMETAMRTPDYILIADLSKYEIKPIIDTWKDQLMDL